MVLELYCWDPSAPTRGVYLCASALNLNPERKLTNLYTRDQFSPEFTKINPQHTIPTIIDDGFVLWDSHAICCYLVSKYGKDDSLYPKDLQKRAIVDQRLHFDSGILFPCIMEIIVPLIWRKTTNEIPERMKTRVLDAYGLLEQFLEGRNYVAGDSITVADFCCVSSVSTLAGPLRIPPEGFPRVQAWVRRCEQTMTGYKEAQEPGLAIFAKAVEGALARQ